MRRLSSGFVLALCLAILALLSPVIVGASLSGTPLGGVARADSLIDPNASEPSSRPTTHTYDEDGNETGRKDPNSRDRILDDAVSALKTNPPIYVDPRAQLKLTDEEKDQLALQISASGDPIYVAVLPSQAGRPTVVAETIAKEVGKPGVYATIVGVVYASYATEFDAEPLLTQAFLQKRHDGQAAVLGRFAELASERIHGQIPPEQPFPSYFVFIVAAMALALPVVLLLSARRNKENPAATGQSAPESASTQGPPSTQETTDSSQAPTN